jgi:hypothetical protein
MKPRHHLYLDDDLTERLEALAAKPGSSKSAIVADALRSYLAQHGAKELDGLLKVRLDRVTARLGRIERDLQILMETLAIFVRYEFMMTPPLPEAQQAAARALARDRYHALIEQVGRRIAEGRTVGRDLGLSSPERSEPSEAEA